MLLDCCLQIPLFTQTLPPSRKTETNEHQWLQIPLDSDVRYSTIHVNDLFKEVDKCSGQYSSAPQFFIHCKFDSFAHFYCRDPLTANLVFHHATLVQLLTPLAPVWYQLEIELGLTTHVKKI